jgi:hypothetical protein
MILEYGNEEYELPKKTLKIAKMIEEVYKSNLQGAKTYEVQYKFVCDILGKSVANQLLDGKSINDIDLIRLSILFLSIDHAYKKEVEEFQEELNRNQLDTDSINKIVDIGKSVTAIQGVKK